MGVRLRCVQRRQSAVTVAGVLWTLVAPSELDEIAIDAGHARPSANGDSIARGGRKPWLLVFRTTNDSNLGSVRERLHQGKAASTKWRRIMFSNPTPPRRKTNAIAFGIHAW